MCAEAQRGEETSDGFENTSEWSAIKRMRGAHPRSQQRDSQPPKSGSKPTVYQRVIGKQSVFGLYSGMVSGLEDECITDTCYYTDEHRHQRVKYKSQARTATYSVIPFK